MPNLGWCRLAMAWLNLYRKDQTDTYSFLDNEGSKHYKKVNKYLTYWLEKSENGYYKGVIIANNLKIKTVIIPTIYNVGKDYTLYTFTDDGKLIDKLIIGAESSDYESKFGVIESFDKIKITTKIIGYKSNSKLYFYSSSKTEYFKVSQSGKILKK